MHIRLRGAAAKVAVFGGILALGLGSTQAAVAQPGPIVYVPCSTTALVNDMTSPANGTVLILAPDCTYKLTASLPTVTTTLTIVGHFNTWITRSGEASAFTIFVVSGSTGNLTLINVNVSNGGGTGEYGVDDGGALYVDSSGRATIRGGIFDNNNTNYYGGAIANYGSLTVTGATFTDNSSEWGGAIYSETDGATIGASTFRGNYASDDGGAIYNDDWMKVWGSTFTSNSADDEGGGIYNAYILTVSGGSFSKGEATYGGGIDNQSTLTLNGVRIAGNDAEYGGGIYNRSTLTANASSIGLNTAYDGAGLYMDEGTANFTGGIFLLNRATDEGGGIFVNYDGDETVTLTGTNMMFNTPDNCFPTGDVAGC